MTKSISSYPEAQQRVVVERRLRNKSGGSGYWAAVQAAEKLGIPVPSKAGFKPRRAESDEDRRKREKKQELRRRPQRSGNQIKNFMRTK
jgi:hypothetical protein